MIKNSVIVPAYNEERRSAHFIPDLLKYVKNNVPNTEVIVVNDGSKDDTESVVKSFIKQTKTQSFAKVIGYRKNQGKGNAVAFGVQHAKGEKILFIDADGSIPPAEIPKLLKLLDDYDVVAGDRMSAKSKVKSNPLRKLFSFGFNSAVSLIFQYSYRDNLCGFKGFKKHVAKEIFKDLKDKRWVFDVELFYKIKKKGYSSYFLPIAWHHVGGSRIRYWIDPALWFFRLIKLRFQLRSYQ
jgi:dolichyl-phosphate beta-glucosyltransferase